MRGSELATAVKISVVGRLAVLLLLPAARVLLVVGRRRGRDVDALGVGRSGSGLGLGQISKSLFGPVISFEW